jgi:hypothetical protein
MGITRAHVGLLQRKCGGGTPGPSGECEASRRKRLQRAINHQSTLNPHHSEAPPIVQEVLRSSGQPLDAATRAFMEPRFGHDFSQVRIHTDARAAESARAVNALAYTVGQDVVFAVNRYSPCTADGQKLLAHELVHTMQQTSGSVQCATGVSQLGHREEREADRVADQVMQVNNPDLTRTGWPHVGQINRVRVSSDEPLIQRQALAGDQDQGLPSDESEEGIEVGDLMMLLPRQHILMQPLEVPSAGQGGGAAILQRQQGGAGATTCDNPTTMRKVTSGKFEGSKTLDDYYPDLVGKGFWDKNDAAGPFDNGTRAGSALQFIGEYPSPCAGNGSQFTFSQATTIVRARADGKKLMEGGKPFEGQTIDDIKRSGRDQSKAPFRQTFDFAVSIPDAISGIPYSTLKTYEFDVKSTVKLSGVGGAKSVDWGIVTEAKGGKVTKNILR